ncbi:MAG: amidohydrolase [Chloroflexi bacterium]|nr:amidohydrolase [Chloroflexota bacterium]
MKQGFKVIDSDLHWIEPANLYDKYIDERYRSRAPRAAVTAEGRRIRVMDGKPVPPWIVDPKVTKANRPLTEKTNPFLDPVRRRDYDAPSFLQAMDIEGIDIAVMFRSLGSMYISDDDMDADFAAALARGFNDWAADFCKTDPRRFKGTAIVSQHDPEEAAREARRAVEQLGMAGIALLPMPIAGKHVHDQEFDVLWKELERLNVPACFHGTSGALSRDYVGARMPGHPAFRTLSHAATFTLEMMLAAGSVILGGVLQRFPNLRVSFLEGNCSWLPWWLYRIEDQWEKYGPGEDIQLEATPTEFFLRQCYISVDPDEDLVRHVVEEFGDDNIVFSTDFPHPDGAYPHAVENFLAMDSLSRKSKRKILWDNCARLYALESPVPA